MLFGGYGASVDAARVEGLVVNVGSEPEAFALLNVGSAYASAREIYQFTVTGGGSLDGALDVVENAGDRVNGFADALDELHVPVEPGGLVTFMFDAGAHVFRYAAGATGQTTGGTYGSEAAGFAADQILELAERFLFAPEDRHPDLMTGDEYRDLVIRGSDSGAENGRNVPLLDVWLAKPCPGRPQRHGTSGPGGVSTSRPTLRTGRLVNRTCPDPATCTLNSWTSLSRSCALT